MADLSAVLEELDAWFADERPDLYPRLRPGLSEHEIQNLEARVAPYALPDDLVTVYRWHDGWEAQCSGAPYVGLHHDCSFHTLRATVELYETLCGLNREIDDLWNPLWFPAFGDQSGELVELQPERGLLAGPLWSFHSHDGEVYTTFDSVTSLFRTTLELWRAGLLPLTQGQWPEMRQRIVSHNPVARYSDGSSRLRRSTAPSLDWPDAWLIAAGVERPRVADDADVITIAELLTDPSCERPVRGEYRCAMGSGAGWETGALKDETGSIKVHLERESTRNYRWLRASNRLEMTLTPITEGDTVVEALAGCGFESDLEESVTRRLLDASAASFHATRVVPLPRVDEDGSQKGREAV